MNVTIKEVATKKMLKDFVKFPNILYKENPYYVPQIESMDFDTLSPDKNRAFEVCEGKYWLAYNETGKIVGRIAGIINHQYNEKVGAKICRFGWMDFIDSEEVVNKLLEAAEGYARQMGMEIMNGPTGFLEFDAAGVLVEGFDKIPTAYGKYNAPYYEQHLLNHDYRKDTDFVEYLINVPTAVPENFTRAVEILPKRYGLRILDLNSKKELMPYADGVFECMNRCYSNLHGFSELSAGQCDDLKKQFIPNLNLDYVTIIVDAENKVVAFGVAMPSLSKAMQKAKGHMFPCGWYHILKALHKNDTIDSLLIAIDDQYKNKGLNAIIFEKVIRNSIKNGVKFVESTRHLEENVQVQNLWNRFEHKMHKRARVYVKEV